MWGALPADPRCKLCNAPFRGPGGVLTRVLAFGPSPLNRRLCRWCIRSIHKHPGGAEIELSVLFVDVRGSTSIAEELPPGEYSKLLARFYGVLPRRSTTTTGSSTSSSATARSRSSSRASPAASTPRLQSPPRAT